MMRLNSISIAILSFTLYFYCNYINIYSYNLTFLKLIAISVFKISL